MRNYEVTFIVDPVLSGEEIKSTAQTYIEMLKEVGATIVHVDEMGLRTLAYPINKRNSGVYYCIEIQVADGELVDDLELALRRDERIMRFLTYKLDKFGIKYNEDKRNGLIAKAKRPKSKDKKEREAAEAAASPAPKAAPAKAAPAAKPAPAAPVAAAPVVEAPVEAVQEEE
ncbi:MAG: 30S ribosomal protein S6 [Saprospiraceae bacterium]